MLTVEILQNFKFHEISNWIFILIRICLKQNLFGVGFYYFNEFNNYNKNPIIYVHELQNLFYCLTKEELTINNS